MPSSAIICATARSGSNVLCEVLSSLGFAGRPEEHLWDPPGTEPEPLTERWPRVVQAGTGPNGVFGLKLLWYQAEWLEGELPAALGMPAVSLPEVLAAVLPDPRYISLTRRDHLRQAISFARAKQTGRWRSMDFTRGEPSYDAAAITDALRFIEAEETAWEDFYVRHCLNPFRVTYEQFDADPTGTVHAILQFLGHDVPELFTLPVLRPQRQADELTEEWLRRYRSTAQSP